MSIKSKAGAVVGGAKNLARSGAHTGANWVSAKTVGDRTDGGETITKFDRTQQLFTVGHEINKTVQAIYATARKHANQRLTGTSLKQTLQVIGDSETKVRGLIEKGTKPAVDTLREKVTRMRSHIPE